MTARRTEDGSAAKGFQSMFSGRIAFSWFKTAPLAERAFSSIHHHLHIARGLCQPDRDRPAMRVRDETTELHMVGFADKLFHRWATFGLRHLLLFLAQFDRSDLKLARI